MDIDLKQLKELMRSLKQFDLSELELEKNGERMSQWVDHLFNRHYMAGYLREMERLRRAAQPAPRERDH